MSFHFVSYSSMNQPAMKQASNQNNRKIAVYLKHVRHFDFFSLPKVNGTAWILIGISNGGGLTGVELDGFSDIGSSGIIFFLSSLTPMVVNAANNFEIYYRSRRGKTEKQGKKTIGEL